MLREAVTAALPPKTPQQISSLARWTEMIAPWLADGATQTAIDDRVRLEQADFTGSLSAVKRRGLMLDPIT